MPKMSKQELDKRKVQMAERAKSEILRCLIDDIVKHHSLSEVYALVVGVLSRLTPEQMTGKAEYKVKLVTPDGSRIEVANDSKSRKRAAALVADGYFDEDDGVKRVSTRPTSG